MRLRQHRGERLAPRFGACAGFIEPANVDAIGGHGRVTTVQKPMIEPPFAVEKVEQQRLVIALEEARIETDRKAVEQHLDHAAAVRPAIHVVAEKDESLLRSRPVRGIGLDLAEKCGEQVRPAVDITHGIEQFAFWQFRDHVRSHRLRTTPRKRLAEDRTRGTCRQV